MRKLMDRNTVIAAVGFAVGYYVGRHYDLTLVAKRVK